ncbi:NAD(P)-dependent oxidoreductase [Melittangium boletus]|uniref:NAD-dependent epimerase n=1 Tax=Melittangium boletus DSM 14713 TaxID=1294270 RepID=A0A250IEK4_9BACT|nr:SDR family oxidoreductase [Melittangium boletus]ATB29592.1 NAD-dependent epimerase [Melittangium boletus DSM 14713]
MKLALFGASGATGHLVLEQALARGHTVTALVRTPSKLTTTHERLKVIQGDVTDPAAVEKTIAGQEAVISTIGSGSNTKHVTLYSDSIRNIIDAMEKQKVERLLCISAGGAYPGKDPGAPFILNYIVKPFFLKDVFADMARMEDAVKHSKLSAWTIVRPPRLVDKPPKGHYRQEETYCIKGGNKIARGDVAEFLVGELDARKYIRQGVAVAY